MDLSYVKKLIKLLSDSEVDEIEIEEEGKKIRVVKHRSNSAVGTLGVTAMQFPMHQQLLQSPVPMPSPQTQPQRETPAAQPEATQKKLHEIKSPIVGTFYKAPAPDAAPFVEVGSVIQPGVVLCIVEAMKLMNEIESDVSGKIVKVMAQNGQAVEYGQTLFIVEPT